MRRTTEPEFLGYHRKDAAGKRCGGEVYAHWDEGTEAVSTVCHGCGEEDMDEVDIYVEKHACPHCGLYMSADGEAEEAYNARYHCCEGCAPHVAQTEPLTYSLRRVVLQETGEPARVVGYVVVRSIGKHRPHIVYPGTTSLEAGSAEDCQRFLATGIPEREEAHVVTDASALPPLVIVCTRRVSRADYEMFGYGHLYTRLLRPTPNGEPLPEYAIRDIIVGGVTVGTVVVRTQGGEERVVYPPHWEVAMALDGIGSGMNGHFTVATREACVRFLVEVVRDNRYQFEGAALREAQYSTAVLELMRCGEVWRVHAVRHYLPGPRHVLTMYRYVPAGTAFVAARSKGLDYEVLIDREIPDVGRTFVLSPMDARKVGIHLEQLAARGWPAQASDAEKTAGEGGAENGVMAGTRGE